MTESTDICPGSLRSATHATRNKKGLCRVCRQFVPLTGTGEFKVVEHPKLEVHPKQKHTLAEIEAAYCGGAYDWMEGYGLDEDQIRWLLSEAAEAKRLREGLKEILEYIENIDEDE